MVRKGLISCFIKRIKSSKAKDLKYQRVEK